MKKNISRILVFIFSLAIYFGLSSNIFASWNVGGPTYLFVYYDDIKKPTWPFNSGFDSWVENQITNRCSNPTSSKLASGIKIKSFGVAFDKNYSESDFKEVGFSPSNQNYPLCNPKSQTRSMIYGHKDHLWPYFYPYMTHISLPASSNLRQFGIKILDGLNDVNNNGIFDSGDSYNPDEGRPTYYEGAITRASYKPEQGDGILSSSNNYQEFYFTVDKSDRYYFVRCPDNGYKGYTACSASMTISKKSDNSYLGDGWNDLSYQEGVIYKAKFRCISGHCYYGLGVTSKSRLATVNTGNPAWNSSIFIPFVIRKTPTPTLEPTSIPSPSLSPSPLPSPSLSPTPQPTITSACTGKIDGDANCDGTVTDVDYVVWRCEFLGHGDCASPVSHLTADFDLNGGVDLVDFEIWRQNKFNSLSPVPSLSLTPSLSPVPTLSPTPVETTENCRYVTSWATSGNELSYAIAIDSLNNVYVGTGGNADDKLQKFSSTGALVAIYGSYGSTDGKFSYPRGIAFDSTGNIYVADKNNNRIQKFSSTGTFITKWGTAGSGDGQFDYSTGVAVDSLDNVYVVDSYNNRIQKFSSTGTFITKWGVIGSADGQFNSPYGIAIDSVNNIYITDTGNDRVQKFNSTGTFITKWGVRGSADGQFSIPLGVAIDSSNNVYVVANSRVQKFNSTGTFITKWGVRGSADGQFNSPYAIAIDSLDNIYVADTNNRRIQKFTCSAN